MKKLPVILSLLSTSLMGSFATNSMEELPTRGGVLGAPPQPLSEFRLSFESAERATRDAPILSSPSPSLPVVRSAFREDFESHSLGRKGGSSEMTSSSIGRSAFYDEVLAAGTRHQFAAAISREEAERDERNRILEVSRREAQEKEDLATALAESETLALANLKKKEIAQLKDQIETLEAFQEAQHQHESNLTDSLIATISKKYAHGATDTEESRAAAHVDYNRINEELDVTRSQNQLIRKEISDLRRKLNDLKYGSFLIPVASSEHLPSGIGGPGGLVPTGLHPIPSSALALPVSSAVPTDTGVDKL